jgi:NAD(P)-dependent dehydrogenase (short-subunit alcohol dehydrogenase family)
MDGKVVLITGAGRACGRALAEDFAARGAAVVVNDIDADGGRRTVQRIEAAGGPGVNMSSVTSDLTAAPLNGLYGASKGGVDALTKAAAVEVAKEGISINALAFLGADVEDGMFQRFLADTGLPQEQILAAIPIGRLLAPAELCAAVRFLLSDEARFVVGTTLVLDGGFTAT